MFWIAMGDGARLRLECVVCFILVLLYTARRRLGCPMFCCRFGIEWPDRESSDSSLRLVESYGCFWRGVVIWDSALGALERWRPWGFGVGATWIFTIAHKSPIKEKRPRCTLYRIQKGGKIKEKQKQKQKNKRPGRGKFRKLGWQGIYSVL